MVEPGITNLLKSWGWPVALIAFVLAVFKNPDKVKLWVGWIWFFFSKFLIKSWRKKAVGAGVESRCATAIKAFSKQTPGFSLPELKIKWATTENIGTILQDGKAIIKLNYSYDDPKNVVAATSQYVKAALLVRTKPYLDVSLKNALDFSIIKKLLLSIRKFQGEYLSLYLNENPLLDPTMRQKCAILEDIDESGLFTRVVLKELDTFGDKLAGKMPKPEYNEEAHKFIDFIYRIAIREYDDQTELLFEDKFINVAVVLVAKVETFQQFGVAPYLRRIKQALARGVEDFYLLARNEKVDILKQVAKKLLETGYFVQEHKPLEFKDHLKRDSICYYFKINKDGLIATATREIAGAKENGGLLSGIIRKVTREYLNVEYDGMEGVVQKANVSSIPINDLTFYFKGGDFIQMKVIDTLDDGVVNFETKDTESDPNRLFQQHLSIGKLITGIVKHIDDEFIIVELPGYTINGIAFRNDLTHSKYIFLSEKFKLNEEVAFNITGYDFSRSRVKLALNGLSNPWDNFHASIGEVRPFKVMRKFAKGFVGELEEGVEGILYYSELAWLPAEVEIEKSNIRLSSTIDCRINKISHKDLLVTLTCKIKNSPIEGYFKSNRDTVVYFVITSTNTFGINGIIDGKWNIYIPQYLQSWNSRPIPYKVGNRYKVFIKGVHDTKDKLIGSFREILTHPLEPFQQKYPKGSLVLGCKVKSSHEWGCLIAVKVGTKFFEAVLFKGEFTDKCRISSAEGIFNDGEFISLIVKEVNLEKNKVVMSLKDLFYINRPEVENLKYEESYDAIIAAPTKGSNYVAFIKDVWLDGILETESSYNIGQTVKVRPSRKDQNYLLLTNE